jgi:beta-glucosidase
MEVGETDALRDRFRQAAEGRGQGWAIKEAISSNMGERVLREVYAWPFQDAVRAGVGSVMCSYNQVTTSCCDRKLSVPFYADCCREINNSYACQNSYLLNGVLKDEFQFQGFVVSDCWCPTSRMYRSPADIDQGLPNAVEWPVFSPVCTYRPGFPGRFAQ